MILQALYRYYAALAAQGKIAPPGWDKVKISWGLELDTQGRLVDVLPLRNPSKDGKKMLPREMELPAPVKRTSGIAANFLWDNTSYLLGLDTKGNPKRATNCFEAAREWHLALLSESEDSAAQAICAFFRTWQATDASSNLALAKVQEELLDSDNLTFFYEGRPAAERPEIQEVWQQHYAQVPENEAMPCLVTGQLVTPERVHPAIKHVPGAQSSGAALVSFNAPAFCSFGREQNANAPVGKDAAFAYTSALNMLLADRDHVKQVGNTTVVYWAEDAEVQYQDVFSCLLDGGDDSVTEEDLRGLMEAIAAGRPYDFDGLPVQPGNTFYVLGLSPNAARLSVRFFYRSSFGEAVRHLKRHYEDIDIVPDHRNRWRNMPLWALLRETVNLKASDKSPLPQLTGAVWRSMLSGTRYPETLVYQTLLRIRAEHDVTRGRAGILKAYLIRNTTHHPAWANIQEVTTVSLNPESNYTPYVLGRLFAVLEAIQQSANPGITATIKDRFFNGACATPAAAFPLLLKLSSSHLRKLEGGQAVYWSRQVGELMERLGIDFPVHLSLSEQGSFILGYYHQTQKRYEKKPVKPNNQKEGQ